MNLVTKKMTEKNAIDILTWKYEKPYDLYNNVLSGDAILELLDGSYKVITDTHNRTVGYFCLGRAAQVPAGDQFQVYKADCIDVGIGMKPELTGKGNGEKFFSHILESIYQEHPNTDIRLTVATFNERAIHLYEKFGFIRLQTFNRETTEFITMIKHKG
ncbi:GNAT family N-acetyltransferase [Ornithinibacillus salinisoli]|uniref:GNAT family N-acetyltransferase n=1 Tax=Ornithinibacillus salinisoli TaxID=1848459 RepID=A0ABW4VX96_9BACI